MILIVGISAFSAPVQQVHQEKLHLEQLTVFQVRKWFIHETVVLLFVLGVCGGGGGGYLFKEQEKSVWFYAVLYS